VKHIPRNLCEIILCIPSYPFVCALLSLIHFSGSRILQLVALGTGSTRQVGTCRTIIVYMAIPREPRPLFAMMHSFDFTYKEIRRRFHFYDQEVSRMIFKPICCLRYDYFYLLENVCLLKIF